MSAAAAMPPPGYEQDQNRGPAFFGYTMFMMCLALVSVSLRFWSRFLSPADARFNSRFWWDDWMALIALPLCLVAGILAMVMVHLGLGHHTWDVAPANMVPAFRVLFSIYFFYDLGLACFKASALLFYSRIFQTNIFSSWFKWSLYTLHTMNILWVIGLYIANFLQCQPVAKNWNPFLPGKCTAVADLWIGSAVPSMIIDLFILLLPLPMIWGLALSTRRKAGLLTIFILGYCTIFISIGRVIAVTKEQKAMNADFFYESVPVLYWICAEMPITALSICLPAMMPLGRRVMTTFSPVTSKLSSMFSSRNSSATDVDSEKGTSHKANSKTNNSGNMQHGRFNSTGYTAHIRSSNGNESDSDAMSQAGTLKGEEREKDKDVVNVKNTVTVSRFEEEESYDSEPELGIAKPARVFSSPKLDV